MPSYTKADERIKISIADTPELAAMLRGNSETGGEIALRGALEDMLGSGTLILDGLRRRPRFFDGRFLTGADLTRDQDYVRRRQADMSRAAGSGVISGLMVSDDAVVGGDILTLAAGHGITPNGDLVMLTTHRKIALTDLAVSRQLDAVMGISAAPSVPLSNRSGLFVLGLRAVEFTANPIAAYPRSITGQATVEDGDIIEASAVTLIAYPDMGGAANLEQARKAIARQIFGSKPTGLPQNILPLAMLALDGGSIRWIDVAMVRREIGADSGVRVSLGVRPRALAEAHLVQHTAHMQDVLEALQTGSASPPQFAANQFFSLLPPAGQLPIGAVQPDADGFAQFYFPPSVDVDIAFVPSDEIAALVDESLALPPIDLDAAPDELDATGIVILIPVNRQRYQRFSLMLSNTSMPVIADPSLNRKSSTINMLDALLLRQRKLAEAQERDAKAQVNSTTAMQEVQNWRSAFGEAIANVVAPAGQSKMLWYVRRRSIAYRSQISGMPLKISGDDIANSAIVAENLGRLGLEKRLNKITALSTAPAAARAMALLGSPRIAQSNILTAAVISDLEKIANGTPETLLPERLAITRGANTVPRALTGIRPNPLDNPRSGVERITAAGLIGRSTAVRIDTELGLSEAEVLDLMSDYGSPRLGEGFSAVQAVLGAEWPEAKEALFIGESGIALSLDSVLQRTALEGFSDKAKTLAQIVRKKDSVTLQEFITKFT
jgi:hypothetical protein